MTIEMFDEIIEAVRKKAEQDAYDRILNAVDRVANRFKSPKDSEYSMGIHNTAFHIYQIKHGYKFRSSDEAIEICYDKEKAMKGYFVK